MALLAELFGLQTSEPLPPTIGDDEMRRAIAERVRQAQGPITTGPQPVAAPELPPAEPVRDYVNTPAQGAYQPSMGSMSIRPQAVAAPVPAPVAAPAVTARQPTLSDRLTGFAEGYQSGGLIGAIGKAGEGVDRKVETENLTIKTLMSKGGMSAEEATAVARNPTLLQAALPAMFGAKTQVVNNRLIDSRTGKVLADYSDSARQGPQIQKVTDADGNETSVVWDAPANRWKPVDLGAAPPPATQGAANQQPAVAPPPPGVNRKEYRSAQAKELGEQRGKSVAALPEIERASAKILKDIDGILNHRSLNAVVGPVDNWTPTVMPGSRDVLARITETQGEAFLAAFNALRGAGAITQTEGDKATASLSRLFERGVTEADYRKAAKEFRDTAAEMTDVARQRAGVMSPEHVAARSEARAAISKGAPRADVAARLKQAGIDAAGF